MNENDDKYETSMSDFDIMSALQQRIAQKQTQSTSPQSSPSKSTIDPYEMMVKRKQENEGEVTRPVQTWPEADVKKLEDFCSKMGILGINCGSIPPLVILQMLKNKFGIMDETDMSKNSEKQLLYG